LSGPDVRAVLREPVPGRNWRERPRASHHAPIASLQA
jgi:hypothetical protein